MKTGKKFYWDTCIFISYLAGRKDAKEMAGIDEVVKLVEGGDAIIVTSVITRIEVLAGKSELKQDTTSGLNITDFFEILRQNYIEEVAVNHIIAQKAHDVRSYYRQKGRTLQVPDAIHLATGMLYAVDMFHTFDGIGKNGGLLTLNGDDGVANLSIQKPSTRQGALGFA